MAQQIVIDIGARIQVLQSSIVEVQKVLDKLQPNTSAWRDLSKYIQSMRGELDKLTLQNGKPVVDQKQFTAAEKSLSKIEEVIGKTQLIMSRLKFSDIKLDPNQQKQFDDLQHRMDAAAEKFEAFKQKTTQAFLETGNNKNDLANLFNANILTKDLDTISQKISEKLMAIEIEIDNKTEAIKRLKPGIEIAKALNDNTGENVLSNTFLSAFTDQKFFDKSGNFAAGMRQQFFDMLAETFKLDSTQKNQLAQLSANELRTIFSGEKLGDSKGNKGLSDFISKKTIQTAAGLGTNLDDSIRNLKQQQALLIQLQTGAGASQDDIAAQAEKVADAEEKLNREARALQESITSAARSTPEMTNSLSQMNSQLQQTREVLAQTNAQFIQLERVRTSFNAMKMAIVNFMGFRQVLNLVKRGVQEAMTHIKELDSVMNKISIVTDMSTGDLWKQVDAYSKLAQQYGVSIKGAYEVSQIYYQQGLDTKDVMTLTNETLKLSKISGLDYATSTDYMTTAIRGFKMEMEDAGRVVDVYSNLAANTAVSQEELAVAMSKTASSMEGVGATFEEASAMIATVVAVTRESATNIGSAMKSIASRYGELTKDPLKLIDSEGEEMAFNKVDAALQSVGISMKTADGQFRDFTDVIVELSEKWDTLESTQQRYIATQFAGNRQQSRFLALVSNEDLLKKNLKVAEDSEDVGSLQALKALDSIESKLEQVTVAYQQFYTTIGAENVWKNMLGGATSVINTLNGLPKLFGTLPIGAIQVITSIVGLIKNVGTSILTDVANIFVSVIQESGQAGNQAAQQFTNNFSTGILGGIQKGWHNIKGSFKDVGYAIGIGRGKTAEVQAEETTKQLNVESARQEFERLKTYAQNELGQTIQLQFDASQPQASVEQLKIQLEQMRETASDTFKIPEGAGRDDVSKIFTKWYQEYQKLANDIGQKPVEIKFDINNPKQAIRQLQTELEKLPKRDTGSKYNRDLGNAKGTLTRTFGPNEKLETPMVPIDQYKELKSEMNEISGIMTTLEAKGKNLSPREAKAMYAQLTQHIKEASVELEKMKQANPNSKEVKEYAQALEEAKTKAAELNTNIQKTKTSTNTLSSAAGALNMIGTLFNNGTAAGYGLSGAIMAIAGALYLVDGISKAIVGSNPFFALAMGAMGVINGISQFMNMQAKEIEIAEKKAEELSNKAKQAKADYKSLDSSKKKIEELTEKRYESAEAAKEYQEAVDDLTSKFPELIGGFNDAGEVILNTSEMEAILAAAREKSAQATYDAAQAELDASKKRLDAKKGQIETDFNKLGIGDQKVFVSTEEVSDNIREIAYKTFAEKSGIDVEDLGYTTGDLERAVKELAKGDQQDTLWNEYLGTVYDQKTRSYNYSLASYGKFLSSKEENLPNMAKDILSLINAVLPSDSSLNQIADIDKAIATFNSSQGSDQIIENYNNLMNLLNNLFSTEEGKEQFSQTYGTIYDQLKNLSKDIDEVNAENTLYKAYSKQVISAWQNTLQKNTQLYSYLNDSSQLAQFTTNAIQEEIDTKYSGDFTKYKNDLKGQTPKIIKTANEFWKSLAGQTDENGKELQDIFNEMASDPRYSGKDIVEYFNKYGLGSYEGLQDAIVDSYVNSAIVIKDRILNNISQTSKKTKQPVDFSRLSEFVNDYDEQFTAFDENYFSLLTKQAYNLEKSGFKSEDLVNAGIDLFKIVDDFDTKISAQVLDIILKNGITTKEGLDASLKEIENIEGIGDALDWDNFKSKWSELYTGIFSNLSLSISSTMDKFLSDWEDIEKEVSKLTSGVSIKEASDIVAKAKNFKNFDGLSLNDFKTSGDKLVLSSELTEKYLQAYLEDTTSKIDEYEATLNGYNNILAKDGQGNTIKDLADNISTKEQLKAFNVDKSILDAVEEDENKQITNRDKIAELILEHYKNVSNQVDEANLQLAWANNVLKTNKWKKGDYSSLSTQLTENWQTSFEEALKNGVTKSQREATPDLKPAVDSAQSAYNSLISDLLSKGFNNINLADYEGLYQSEEVQKNLDASKNLSSGYASFISLYSSYLGKTTEEINDLMVQAIQKDTQTTRGAAEVLKKFSFIDENTFTASIDDLKEFANIFGANINDWITSGTATWSKELGAYIVNKANLALPDGTKINVDEIENAMDITVDSINKTLEDLANTIIKGISGKLTKTDVTNLNKMLETLGIKNLNLNFQQTSDGLKLAQESAIALYSELKKINAIQAQIVFDDLSKSLQENNENYKNISDIMNHIVQLQENIADADSRGDNTRANQYREELALAKEILAVRSTTEDSSFDFMSNKIPGAQNNPLNYYNSWAKAIKTLQDAQQVTKTVRKGGRKTVEKGFIDYQDWYNIATEMGNIAKLGGPIKVAGITLDGSLEQTAKLIEKGASALTTVDTGEIKVALGGIGLDLTSGANDMTKGVDKGIQAVAKSQIKMLDGMISLLETIVAMEKLGEIDLENDGVIDLSDLGIKFEGADSFETTQIENIKKFTTAAESFSNAVNEIGSAADEVKVGGKSLRFIANKLESAKTSEAAEEVLKELHLSGQDLQTLMDGFYQLSKENGWDETGSNLQAMIDKYFAGKLDVTVDVNPYKDIKFNYNDKDFQKKMQEVFKGKNLEANKKKAQELLAKAKKEPQSLNWEQQYQLNYLTGEITVTKGKDGKLKYHYNGKIYHSKKEVGEAINFQQSEDLQNVSLKRNAKGNVIQWTGTKTIGSFDITVTQDGNGKNRTYSGKDANGETKTFNSQQLLLNHLALTQFEKDSKENKNIEINKLDKTAGTATVNLGKQEIKIKVDDKGRILYEGADGKDYVNFDDYIASVLRQEQQYVSQEDIEKRKISIGYTIIPDFSTSDMSVDKLNARNIKNLKGTTAEQLMKDWENIGTDKDKLLDFKYKYGFTLEKTDENTSTELNNLIKILNEQNEPQPQEVKMVVTAEASGANADIVNKILNKEEITVPVKLNISNSEDNSTEESNAQSIDVIATIVSYLNGENVDPNTLVSALTAFVISLTNNSKDDPNSWVSALSAIVTSLTNNSNTDPNSWVNSLEALITSYTDEGPGADSKETLLAFLNTLSAIVTAYSDEGSKGKTDIENAFDDLTAKVIQYSEEGTEQNKQAIKDSFHQLKGIIISYGENGQSIGQKNTLLEAFNAITALVIAYSDTNAKGKAEIESTFNDLEGLISKYTEAPTPEGKKAIEDTFKKLEGLIIKYDEIGNPEGKKAIEDTFNELKGLIISYSESGTVAGKADIEETFNELKGLVISYSDESEAQTAKENLLEAFNTITALVIGYSDTNAEGKDTILDPFKAIEAIIKTINDTTLTAWWEANKQKEMTIYTKVEETPEDPIEKRQRLEQEKAILERRIKEGRATLNNGDAESYAKESGKPIDEVKKTIRNEIELDEASLAEVEKELEALGPIEVQINESGIDETKTKLQDVKSTEDELSDKSIKIEANTSSAIKGLSAVRDEIANIKGKSVTITTYKRTVEERTQATGNVSLATGNAMAQGTLMGELGPELVVSKGRYFVVGQEGAEFVNLDKDAIVFNHIQTQSLLKNGKAGRGKPQTNECNATSLATGNVGGGPAMASASAALAALRQLRAQWQALAGLGVSDLAQKAGGGGGGGGGGKDKDAAFIRDVERWYNWLQKIAQLEKEITHEEQLRSKLESDRNKNGKAYYESQKKSLADIREQTAVTTSLLTSQQEYFNQRRKELNKSPMSRFYTFDENGQLQYTKNPEGFAELSDLFGRNDEGRPNYTAEEQYNKLVAMGYASYMKYDSSGKEIKPEGKKPDAAYFENAVKAFSERMDSEKEEMQSLHDSIEEYQTSILELEQKRNELIQEMIDNQIEVENQVLQAIEDMRQAQIDEAQADRDAYSESTEKYINGLNDALNREKQMYENEENEAELEKLRRQLAILERSGGSASQIAGLQKDIQSKEQDLYFDKQQQQINAIKEASDLQIERMDHQIKIMEETLAYEKAHGLLWEKVYEVMAGTPEEIREFIALNTKSLQEQSAAQSEQNLNKMEWQIEQWVAYREDEKKEINTKEADRRWNNSVDSFKTTYSKVYTDELAAKAREAYEASYEKYGDETKAHAAAQEIFKNAQAEYDAAHYVAPTTTTTSAAATTSKSSSGGGSGGNNNNNKSSTTSKKSVVKTSDWEYDAAQHWKTVTYSDGTYGTIDQGNHQYSGTISNASKCTICGRKVTNYSPGQNVLIKDTPSLSSTTTISKLKGYKVSWKKDNKAGSANYAIKDGVSAASAKSRAENYAKQLKNRKGYSNVKVSEYYKYGGLVDYTGLAQVDGTPSRPESFLNANQTAILKKGLLGGKNSLVSVLADFQAMLEGSSHATVEKNNSSIVIENATVQMNVQHMNNDYDARRAGEQALEQIVKVARKTGAQSVSRR